VDETSFLAATRNRNTRYLSGLVDITSGRLLDVVEDRTARAVADWLRRRPPRWLRRIAIVALDPYRGYAGAMLAHLGHATVVVDHFHLIRLANAVVDDVRRRVQQATRGHRGRKRNPLYGIRRRLLLAACDDLDARGWAPLADGLRRGDADGEVTAAWQLKEITRDPYRSHDLQVAREALALLYAWADSDDVLEMRRFAGTVARWQTEILAWHTTAGASNGPTEAVNLAIKNIKRVGRGFATSPTTGCGCCCTVAASTGKINLLLVSGGAHHVWWRRARYVPRCTASGLEMLVTAGSSDVALFHGYRGRPTNPVKRVGRCMLPNRMGCHHHGSSLGDSGCHAPADWRRTARPCA
jgi:Transposase